MVKKKKKKKKTKKRPAVHWVVIEEKKKNMRLKKSRISEDRKLCDEQFIMIFRTFEENKSHQILHVHVHVHQ